MTGIGPGSTGMTGAQPRHDAARGQNDGGPEIVQICMHAITLPAFDAWLAERGLYRYPIPGDPGLPAYGTATRGATGQSHDAAPRPSAAPHSPQTAGVAAGDGTDGPEPPQGTTGAAPGSLAEIARHILFASEVGIGMRCPACHGKPAADRWRKRHTKPQYVCGCGHQWDLPSRSAQFRAAFDWDTQALLKKIAETGELPEIPAPIARSGQA